MLLGSPNIIEHKLICYRLRIRPRVLIDVSKRCTSTNILDLNLDVPIGIAATAMQRMANAEGEKATVRGIYTIII